jgi:lysozyme
MPIRDIKALLTRHEGYRRHPYTDTVGKLTIGIGRNLEDVGLSRAEADCLLDHDLRLVYKAARRYPWFEVLNAPRQAVVVDMIFNLGPKKFMGFIETRRHLTQGYYVAASKEMLNSKWASQVGMRARRLAQMMKTGKWPTVR